MLDRLRGKKTKDKGGKDAGVEKKANKKGDDQNGGKAADKQDDIKKKAKDDSGADAAAGTPKADKNPGSSTPTASPKARPAVPVPGTTATRIYSGGTAMTFPLASTASEFRAAASQYHPKDMFEYEQHVKQLPDVLIDLAEGLKAMTARAQGQLALENGVVQSLAHVYAALRNCIPPAAEVHPTLRGLHKKDLDRRENPRNGLEAEAGWNVQ